MRNWKIWDGQFKIYRIKRCILDLELFKPFFTETSLLEFSKHSLSTQCTVSPPHMNLQVVNFQRCKRAFHQCQAWVKLPFALCLLLLTILQLCHLPPPLPPPASDESPRKPQVLCSWKNLWKEGGMVCLWVLGVLTKPPLCARQHTKRLKKSPGIPKPLGLAGTKP